MLTYLEVQKLTNEQKCQLKFDELSTPPKSFQMTKTIHISSYLQISWFFVANISAALANWLLLSKSLAC